MRTFAELLTEYTARTGVSDAELARAVGVQRQTIFRWKEGLVTRPRSAEDVLHLASKLRLTPAERDELLMAASFPPMNPPAGPSHEIGVTVPAAALISPANKSAGPSGQSAQPGVITLPRRRRILHPRMWAAMAGGILLALVIVAAALRWTPHTDRPQAQAGETLVVIGQFANYTGGAQGYNIAGRVQEALERELRADRLSDARAAVWLDVIPDALTAEATAKRSGALLVIWGEYDSGRVLAHFTAPGAGHDIGDKQVEKLVASPADLATTINSALPEEIRYLALLTVGQVYVDRGDLNRARGILEQAAARPPTEPSALASLYFLLGYTHQLGQPADLDRAIESYSRALALSPGDLSAHTNRGLAYLRRGKTGDAAAAVADLTAVLAAQPDDAITCNNRGAAYLQLGGMENAALAAADFDRAVALAPDLVQAYLNRGLANVRLAKRDAWQVDFARVRVLAPDQPGLEEALCWAYTLDEVPEEALPHCDKAISLAPTGSGRDNRGIVYARSGRYTEAINDLEAYLDGLRERDNERYRLESARSQPWLDALRAGRNPFDAAALEQLRVEP